MAIRFTQHARKKFEVLARHNFVITETQVIDTLESPDTVDFDRNPPIAQKGFDERHVLRVVFRIEGEDKIVITFYPGRRQQYEN